MSAPRNVARKLIEDHLVVEGEPEPGAEIALCIDQTLTQDATGTLVMLELEAMGIERVRTQLSAQYVDHNLLQLDAKNADDHLFLESACRRGAWRRDPPWSCGFRRVADSACVTTSRRARSRSSWPEA